MTEHVKQTVALVQAQVRDLELQVAEKKRMVNSLCDLIGQPPIYASTEPATDGGTVAIRSDEFYGKPLATAVRQILEKRSQASLGAATVTEVYEAMLQGGYHFDAKTAANAKRSLRISLTKNAGTFHKLPNGNYGLLEWYPSAKEPSKANGNGRDAPAEVAAVGGGPQEEFADGEPDSESVVAMNKPR